MDLNIIIQTNSCRDGDGLILRKLKAAQNLGIKVIALAVKLDLSMDEKLVSQIPPAIQIEVPVGSNMTILSRLTVCIGDKQEKLLYKLLQQPGVKEYSLLSFQPLHDKVLNQLTGGSLLCDILSFDMTQRMAVDLKRANLNLLRISGVCFEVNYTDCFRGQSERQHCISSAQLLAEKCKGRNVIVSSGSVSPIQLRAPNDVANIGMLFGLKEQQSKQAAFKNGMLAVKHGVSRKNPNALVVLKSEGGKDEDQDDMLIQRLTEVHPERKKQTSVPLFKPVSSMSVVIS